MSRVSSTPWRLYRCFPLLLPTVPLLWLVVGCGEAPAPRADAPGARQRAERVDDVQPSDKDIRALLSGESVASAPLPDAWRRLVADVRAGRVPLDDDGVPVTLDTRRERVGEAGQFRIHLTPPSEGVAMNRLTTWEVAVSTPAGVPVTGAQIDVIGGMPLHGHGFPTAPAVGAETAPGVYPLEGMRFGMRGWWQVMFAVTAGGVTDVATFDLVVTP